jgi:hypothetical protein
MGQSQTRLVPKSICDGRVVDAMELYIGVERYHLFPKRTRFLSDFSSLVLSEPPLSMQSLWISRFPTNVMFWRTDSHLQDMVLGPAHG